MANKEGVEDVDALKLSQKANLSSKITLNKVSEKKVSKINAVNLTKMNMTPEIEKKVLRGDYGFVYL
ncbi:hypothetical protein MJO29_008663, partial [Puccinia striiformis f. sp. tritici]